MKIDSTSPTLGLDAIMEGILKFSIQRALELIDEDAMRDLRRVGQVEFTANHIANRVFKISVNSARNKIQQWIQMGIVEKIGEEKAGGGRPVYHYAINDVRIARAVLQEMPFTSFVTSKMLICYKCRRVLIRDWDITKEHSCPHCGTRQSTRAKPS